MGDCKHCGKAAGFLKSVHKECAATYAKGRDEIVRLIGEASNDAARIELLRSAAINIASKHLIPEHEMREITIAGWCDAVERSFEDGVLSDVEEANLVGIRKHLGLEQDELDRNGSFGRVVKGGILRDVLNGTIPDRISVQGNIPFNLQKGEKLIWLFLGVKYLEQKTKRHYEGRSHGMSVRVAKGLYLRTGAFRGHPVETTETVHADTGMLGVTDKHLYFSGSAKGFRIHYKKVVSFEPYSDGMGLQRDASSAKPQTFVTGDGWFTYNLIVNLSRMN